jgi:hypothetical protein
MSALVVTATHDTPSHDVVSTTATAPSVRAANESRYARMERMYGQVNADKLLTVATRMDMYFDAVVDSAGAPMWPVIPFNL